MPKVSLDMPQELVNDLRIHVGDEKKFVALQMPYARLAGNYSISWIPLT